MINHRAFNLTPTFHAPQKRIVWWTLVVLALALLATLVVITASANPPNSAELRIQGWVNELQEDRLTAARHNAQRELENAGEQSVPALLVALRSDDAILRRNAADMLGFIASPRSMNGLQYALLNDPVPTVRRNAAWSLGEINSFAAVNDLQRASVLDNNALVRQTAQDSLARIRTRVALNLGIDERDLNAFAVAPQNADIVYAATRRDLKITRDGGATWNTLNNALRSLTNVLAVSPSNPLTLYAGVDSMGMYKSVDGGRDWSPINNGLNVMAGTRNVVHAIMIDPTEPQFIVISTGVMFGTSTIEYVPTGIMRSTDGGMTWTVLQKNTTREPLTQLALKGNQLYALAGTHVLVYPLD